MSDPKKPVNFVEKDKAGQAKPGYDPLKAAAALREEYPEVKLDEEKLLAIAQQGQEAIESMRFALKAATLTFAEKGIPKEADNPKVVLRNKSSEDCVVKTQRYSRDFNDVFPAKDPKTGQMKKFKINRLQNEPIRDDPLMREGMSNLNLKAGTHLVCRISLARLIKEKAGMGDNLVIEPYDPKKHDGKAAKAVRLTDDPSMEPDTEGGKVRKGSARFVGAEEFGENKDAISKETFSVPTGEFNKFNNPAVQPADD